MHQPFPCSCFEPLGLWPSAIGVEESGLCWSESTMSAHCESHIRAHGHWWSWCPPPIPGLMDTTWKFAPRKNLMLFPVVCHPSLLSSHWPAFFVFHGPGRNTWTKPFPAQRAGNGYLEGDAARIRSTFEPSGTSALKARTSGKPWNWPAAIIALTSLASTEGSMPSWTSKSSWIDFTWLEIGRQASEVNLLKENGSGHSIWSEAGVSRVCTCQGLAPTSAIAASIKAPDMTENKERQCQKTTTDRLLEMMPPTCQKNDLCC